jgi:hypothetical protein
LLTPSADTLTINASTETISIPGVFTQTGVFDLGHSGSLVATVPLTFTDTITVDGITQSLVFTGEDIVTLTVDTLNINALGPTVFGDVSLSFLSFTTGSADLVELPVTLTANVSSTTTATTPEPSTFVIFGTGLLGAAGFIRRRLVA